MSVLVPAGEGCRLNSLTSFFFGHFGSKPPAIVLSALLLLASSDDPSDELHPARPLSLGYLLSERGFRVIQRILHECVVQWTNYHPSEKGPSCDLHLDNVPEFGLSFGGRLHLETMSAEKALRFRETKMNVVARHIRFNGIADRSMPSRGPNAQRTVELHRHPSVDRPKQSLREARVSINFQPGPQSRPALAREC